MPERVKLANMSWATLIRHFREKMSCSTNDLLTDIRLTLAANELRKPTNSTEAVVEAVGYQSLAAFRRAFTQRMGMTPGHWHSSAQAPESCRCWQICQPNMAVLAGAIPAGDNCYSARRVAPRFRRR